MNKKYTECDIVRELLPLYIEQKTGEESNELIGRHLPECEECREIYRWMSADWMEEKNAGDTGELSAEPEKGKPKKKSKYVMKLWLKVVVGLTAYIVVLWLIVLFTFLRMIW